MKCGVNHLKWGKIWGEMWGEMWGEIWGESHEMCSTNLMFALQTLYAVQILAKLVLVQPVGFLLDPVLQFCTHVLEYLNTGNRNMNEIQPKFSRLLGIFKEYFLFLYNSHLDAPCRLLSLSIFSLFRYAHLELYTKQICKN